jgi:hypothetical protein
MQDMPPQAYQHITLNIGAASSVQSCKTTAAECLQLQLAGSRVKLLKNNLGGELREA